MSTTHEEKKINKDNFVSFHGEEKAPNDNDRTELITVENVFKEFRQKHMRQIVEQKRLVLLPSKHNLSREEQRKDLLDQLSAACKKSGMKSFVNTLALEIVKDITAHIPDDIMLSGNSFKKDEDTEKYTIGNNVFKKRCYQTMADWGVQKYFKDCKTAVMIKLIEYLDFDVWDRENRKTLINQLQEIIEAECLTTFLSNSVTVKTLKEICEHMYLTVQTSSVTNLVDCMIYGRSWLENSDEDDENKETNIEIPTKIKSGLTKSQLHFFTVDNLKKYLKEHGMVSSGRKTELVNMLLAYFNSKEDALKKYGSDRLDKKREAQRQKREEREGSKLKKEEEERKRSNKDSIRKSDNKKKTDKSSSISLSDDENGSESDNKKKKSMNRRTSKSRLDEKEQMESITKKLNETKITNSSKGKNGKTKYSSESKKKTSDRKDDASGSASSFDDN